MNRDDEHDSYRDQKEASRFSPTSKKNYIPNKAGIEGNIAMLSLEETDDEKEEQQQEPPLQPRGWGTTSTSDAETQKVRSFASIMNEQEDERKASEEAMLQSNQMAEEDELLRIAFERSLADTRRVSHQDYLESSLGGSEFRTLNNRTAEMDSPSKPAVTSVARIPPLNSSKPLDLADIAPRTFDEMCASLGTASTARDFSSVARAPLSQHQSSSLSSDFTSIDEKLSEEELRQIQKAIAESGDADAGNFAIKIRPEPMSGISEEEAASIERALQEADAEEEARSLQLALQLQEEDERIRRAEQTSRGSNNGNIRTMTRAELAAQKCEASTLDEEIATYEMEEDMAMQAGFRMNSAAEQQWNRKTHNSVIGPNNEIRTKHDLELQGRANAHRLGLDSEMMGGSGKVGNQAYNSFLKSVKKSKKGVAEQGTGRAGSDADGTRSGAMDHNVRLQIAKAINNDLIEHCNGVVKEGKEAVIYHADRGKESDGHDVAIKVFKRITEFRKRGSYVDGDPRYTGSTFNKLSSREQLELWAEKEYRNLIRANRAGVPVATPIFQKENMLFMRFMGSDGWPAPQLREVELKKGSQLWTVLYKQTMDALCRLYCDARLVHADLSEYNVMVVPAELVENKFSDDENARENVQAILIDLGQSVDTRHPEALPLLRRDVERLTSFFRRQGAEIPSVDEALQVILEASSSKVTSERELKDAV